MRRLRRLKARAGRARTDGNGDGNDGNRKQPPTPADSRLPRYKYREQGGCCS
jgi:hypothetical protein